MSTKDTGGPAFPNPAKWAVDGMSLRDYFAAKALAGFAAAHKEWANGLEGMAQSAYRCADAMLAERNK